MTATVSSLRFASLFQDHAVLQRDQPIPVWGRGAPGETIVVSLAQHEAETVCGDKGDWLLRLPALPAGGPHTLVVQAASGRVELTDILIGEVWLCSGQSNMEWTLANSFQDGSSTTETAQPHVRLFTMTNPATIAPTRDAIGHWEPGSPASFAKFSAIGGWFGRTLNLGLGVPVGLICNAWGGTRIQAWLSRPALLADQQGAEDLLNFETSVWRRSKGPRKAALSFEEWERLEAPQDLSNEGLARGWAAVDFDDTTWAESPVPGRWDGRTQPKNGILWFRRSVELPAGWAGRELVLHLGAIDKHDDTYVNGERVGGLSTETANAWCTPRIYHVPAALTRSGRIVVAVRARSHVYDGGLTGPASAMELHCIDEPETSLPLAGTWRYAVEQNWGTVTPPGAAWGPDTPNSPAILFASRIAPLVPYGIRGVLWYQGESNAHEAAVYRQQMRLLIRDWRRAWGQGDFPFAQVQLANFQPAIEVPSESRWAELREAQLLALAEPNTGLAVAIDVGEATDIHPRNKRDVGLRLARWALADVYGRGGESSGPVFTHREIDACGRVRCYFNHIGGGLVARDGALRQFALAGANGSFEWAEAEIQGATVVVWSRAVPAPVAVRYAWADNPAGCNLYNREGLPASPFRSDGPAATTTVVATFS